MSSNFKSSCCPVFSCFFNRSNSTVKKLFKLRVVDDDEKCVKKQIKLLLKYLKHQNGAVDELQMALRSYDISTGCILIPKLRSENRRNMAYTYCRLWRWPDLESDSELIPLDVCRYSFTDKDICINPYHYRRIRNEVVPPLFVPRLPNSQNNSNDDSESYSESSGRGSIGSNDRADSNDEDIRPAPIEEPNRILQNQHFSTDSAVDIRAIHEYVPVHFEDPKHWASIAYYEFNYRVGDAFPCLTHSVLVHGNSHEDKEDTFYVGKLKKPTPYPSTKATKALIDGGAYIYCRGGDVYAKCISNSPIFVQSLYWNRYDHNTSPTIIKINPGISQKIFGKKEFANTLSARTESGRDAVLELTKGCTIRISFVIGWGEGYPRRDATETPCWMELHLHGPLTWINRVLTQMASSNARIRA